MQTKEISSEELYVQPHNKVGEIVTNKNIKDITEALDNMYNLCFLPRGKYPVAFAIAHCQVNDKNPLRVFVTYKGEIIANPTITRHTKTFVKSLEGCMSFPEKEMVNVDRYNVIEVDYQTLDENDDLTEIKHKKIKGKESKIWQHEIEHLEGKNIYNEFNK